jgi:hypothetical protein
VDRGGLIHSGFREQLLKCVFDRAGGHPKPGSNFAIRKTLEQKPQNGYLTAIQVRPLCALLSGRIGRNCIGLFFGHIGDDGGQPWDSIFLVGGKPYFGDEGFTVAPMHLALHRRPQLCLLIGPQRILQLWQKCGNRLANQIYFIWYHEFDRCSIRQLDGTALVQYDDCGWTGFDESAQPLLRFEGEPAAAKKFRDEKSTSREG